MVLKGFEEIDWFTDRPDRVEGFWKLQKLLRRWDQYFATSEPNAQVTIEVGEQRELFTFEMFKPKIKSQKMMFDIKPISDSSEDKVTGLAKTGMDKVSLFIDDTSNPISCAFNIAPGSGNNLSGADLAYANLRNANLAEGNLTDASMIGNINGFMATEGAIWANTTCPDGTINITSSPCKAAQLKSA